MNDVVAVVGAIVIGLLMSYMFYRFTRAIKEV